MKKRFKWTAREDKVLVQAIEANPQNKAKAFNIVAEKFKVGFSVPRNRWYNHLSNPESKHYVGCKVTLLSSAIRYDNRTRKSKYQQPVKMKKSIWDKIKSLLKL